LLVFSIPQMCILINNENGYTMKKDLVNFVA
jgi:hypothetical protein